jgi:colanic acid/amylovoran biosynthesis glycosyltransferase
MDSSKRKDKLSVVHLWIDYYINADGNPHHYLKRSMHESNIVAASVITDKQELPDNVWTYSVKKVETVYKSLATRIRKRLLQYFYWKKINSWVEEQLAIHKPGIIHAHFGYTAVRMLPSIKKAKLPLVVTYYGVDGSNMISDPRWIKRVKESFSYTSRIIVLSQIVKDRIKMLGFEEEKITVWSIPIKLDTYVFRQKQPAQQIKFITAARFVEKKGYPFLLTAFAKVHSTSLTIIGYGPAKTKVEEDVARYGLENAVTIIDTRLRTDFHQFYYEQLCQHDIFVLPSTTSKNGDDEAGPSLTLISAQAAGLPVVCTPFVGSEITVFDNETGILCKQDDADSIAEKMIYLAHNPAVRDSIGKAASNFVHTFFTEETQMKKIVDYYYDVI